MKGHVMTPLSHILVATDSQAAPPALWIAPRA